MFYEKELKPFAVFPYDISMCGNSYYQGPLWIRPPALIQSPWRNYNQIVGHTSNKGDHGTAKFKMKNNKELVVVDNITHDAYYEFEL